jgi:uroporphyrinogen decarboxylase
MCGDTRKIWRYMPDLMGSAYSLDQKISLREARSVMKEVTIGGNINPIDTLMFGSPEKVKEESIQAIQDGGPDNFILMPGCGVPPESPVENLKVMVAVAKSWRL